jgi:hypothetical protein
MTMNIYKVAKQQKKNNLNPGRNPFKQGLEF